MPAQVKALFDATGQLWVKGELVGKPAGLFVSTNSQGGGQEVTAYSTIPFFAAQGMVRPLLPGSVWSRKKQGLLRLPAAPPRERQVGGR